MALERILARTLGSPRATRLFFNRIAPVYRWLTNNPLWRDSLREVARHFPPSSGELLLLDVGCGPGNSALQFLDLRSDLRIIGIDFSGEMLRLAQRTASRLSDGVDRLTWTQADVSRLPLPDSSLDAIAGHSVYYMLEDRQAFLREALRVLRPGGRIILLDPLARPYPIELLARALRRPQISLALLGWHTVSRAHDRLTLEQMAARLHDAGFARVLAERAVQGFGVLSRGEKPYAVGDTSVQRIAQTVALEGDSEDALRLIDRDTLFMLDSAIRGRFLFLLVQQTPNKPAWALRAGEKYRWEAATLSDQNRDDQACLLAFTSLPRAVAFMQGTVTLTGGLLRGLSINKIAKFDKALAPGWGVDILLNASPGQLQASQRHAFRGVMLPVDANRAVTGEE